MSTRWFTGIALAEDAGLPVLVPVLPIGTFKTSKYGKFSVTAEAAAEMVKHFEDNTLKTDIRFDIGHEFGGAAGWIRSLAIGTYTHVKTGEELPAVVAGVEWTEDGQKLLDAKEYRYVSAAFGDYKDEETGTVYNNVLHAVSLTNDPVMKMLPPLVQLSSELSSAEHIVSAEFSKGGMRERLGAMFPSIFKLGEVADEAEENRNAYPDGELEAAGWGVWDATSAFERLVRKAISDGLSGDALMSRIEELAADLPLALVESIKASVETAREGREKGEQPYTPPEPTDPTEGISEVTLAADINGDASSGGETDMTEEQVKQLTQERDDALAKLAEAQRADREARIDGVLDKLSKAGIDEESRKDIRAALISTGMVTLAEGKEIDREEALLTALSNAKWVPVTASGAAGSQEPPAANVELTEAEQKIAHQMGISLEMVRGSKKEA